MKNSFVEAIESRVLLSTVGLDPSFGRGGVVTIDLPAPVEEAGVQLAETASGEAIVALVANSRHYLAKLKVDGSQDFSFGQKGLVRLEKFGPMAVDPATGLIAVGGGTSIRFFTPSGQADWSKGHDGVVDFTRALKLDPKQDYVAEMRFAPDGGLIFAATYPNGPAFLGRHSLLIGRLKADGSLDATFGPRGTGILRTNFDLGLARLRVAGDGSIYLLVDDQGLSALDGDVVSFLTPTLVRLTAKGKFDTSFAGDGILEVEGSDTHRSISVGTSLELDRDRAVIVGIPQGLQATPALLRRIRADGSVDPTFGAKGAFSSPGIRSVAEAASGDILSGALIPADENHFFGPATLEIRRLNATGKPVNSWADHGVARTDFSVLSASDVQITPDGKVLIAAQITRRGKQSYVVLRFEGPSENTTPQFAVILNNGRLDIAGSSKADDVRVAMRHHQIQVRIGASEFSFDPASVSGIHIHSGGGADHIRLGDGLKNVYVEAGDGDDIVQGGSGNDNISGGAGNDWLSGGAGYDSLRGYDGRDTLEGGNDNNVLIGGAGDDRLIGGSGTDRMRGQDGNDTLVGGGGFDELSGDAGNDVLNAGDFQQDRVDGGDGIDRAQVDRSRYAVDRVFNVELLR